MSINHCHLTKKCRHPIDFLSKSQEGFAAEVVLLCFSQGKLSSNCQKDGSVLVMVLKYTVRIVRFELLMYTAAETM